jgi:hypothetical protein
LQVRLSGLLFPTQEQCQKQDPQGEEVVVVVVVVVVAWTHGASCVSHRSVGSRVGVEQPQSGQPRAIVSNVSPVLVDHRHIPEQPEFGPAVVVVFSTHGGLPVVTLCS